MERRTLNLYYEAKSLNRALNHAAILEVQLMYAECEYEIRKSENSNAEVIRRLVIQTGVGLRTHNIICKYSLRRYTAAALYTIPPTWRQWLLLIQWR